MNYGPNACHEYANKLRQIKTFPRSSLPVSSANNVENAAEMQCLHKAGSGFCCGQLGCAEGHSPSGMKTKSIYLYILSEILNTVSHLLLLHSSSHLRLPSSIREASSRSNSFITGPMVLYRKKRIIFVNRIYQAKRFNKNFLLNSIFGCRAFGNEFGFSVHNKRSLALAYRPQCAHSIITHFIESITAFATVLTVIEERMLVRRVLQPRSSYAHRFTNSCAIRISCKHNLFSVCIRQFFNIPCPKNFSN